LIFRRNKVQFLSILCLMGALVAGIIAAFPEQLSYGLSGKNTINEGRMAQWNRADDLSAQYPTTGIGPKETVFGSGTDRAGSGRYYSLYTESGYRMSRVSGGFIGLGLLVLLVISSIYLAIKVAKDKTADPFRRQAAFAGAYYMIAMGLGLYITNIVENELMTYYGLALAGIIAPQMHEVYHSYKGRAQLYLNRFAQAQRRMASRPR
jgi:O-antigen ligase